MGLLEAAWVSTVPHIISHVRCVLKVARISEIEVRLTLFELMMSVHSSMGVNIVGLVVHLVVLHVRLTRRRELAIRLSNWRAVMLMAMISLVLAVKLVVCTDSIKVEIRKATANFRHDAPTACSVPDTTVTVAVRGEWLS